MRRLMVVGLCIWAVGLHAAPAKPPKVAARNMTVELRVVAPAEAESPQAGGWRVRTPVDDESTAVAQKIWVLNGERAQLQLSHAMAVQWVKAVAQQRGSSSTAAGDSQTSEGQLLENQTTWLEAEQSLAVTVRWPGGAQAARLDLQISQASPRTAADGSAPQQHRSQLATQVLVPMGEWTTIGVTGPRAAPPDANRFATRSAADNEVRWLQVRVLAP